MKVLFVHDHPFFHFNGDYYTRGSFTSETWSRFFDTELVDFLAVVSRGVEVSEIQEGLVKSNVYRMFFDPVYEVRGGIDYYLKSHLIKDRLRKHIRQVDVVVIRAPSAFGTYAFQVCMELDKPYVVEVVGCTWNSNWNHGSLKGKLRAPLSYFKNKKLIKNSLAALYVTERFLQARYPTRAAMTTHASNVHIPEPDEEVLRSHSIRLSSLKDEHIFKLGLLANISVKYKGYHVAIKALRMLKDRRKDLRFQFFVAGGGAPNYINSLVEKYDMANEVKLLGQLASGDEVFKYLDNLDIYLQPSLTEGLPRSVIEAMSRGCPVLASSAGGIPELLDSHFLHNPGDATKLSLDIEKLLTDKELRIKASKENFEKSKEYTDSVLKKRRLQFYKQAFELVKK